MPNNLEVGGALTRNLRNKIIGRLMTGRYVKRDAIPIIRRPIILFRRFLVNAPPTSRFVL